MVLAGKRSNFKFGREMARIFKILSKRLDEALNQFLNHNIIHSEYYLLLLFASNWQKKLLGGTFSS
jgi:hypothetical protein